MEIVNNTLTLDAIEIQAREQYALALRHAIDAKASAREAVLSMADCGQMLLMGREHVRGPKGEWIVGLGIPLQDAEKAVFLARNRDQLELDLWPQDVAKVGAQFVGMLPPPAHLIAPQTILSAARACLAGGLRMPISFSEDWRTCLHRDPLRHGVKMSGQTSNCH